MSADTQVWSMDVGEWIPLATLFDRVATENEIPRPRAVKLLKMALHSGKIPNEIPFLLHLGNPEAFRWTLRDPVSDRYRVYDFGWRIVDWSKGTIGGAPIYISSYHVERVVERHLATASPKPASQEATPPRERGGRPPKHDWDAFWIEVAHYAAKHDLEPEHRTELQRHMEDWAARTWEDPPDAATIRAKIKKLYRT